MASICRIKDIQRQNSWKIPLCVGITEFFKKYVFFVFQEKLIESSYINYILWLFTL